MPELLLHISSTPDFKEETAIHAIVARRFPCVLGRQDDCDECLTLPIISRRHCVFSLRDDTVWVEDLGSRNGTYLNGERLREAQPLRDRDQLGLAGLVFWVRLRQSPKTAADSGVVSPRHVLVVEDKADTAEKLARLLKQWGHEVKVAPNSSAAAEAAQAKPPDTVLVDVGRPGLDAAQVARELRSQPGLEKATLVALTDQEKTQRRSPVTGFDRLLTMPVDPGALQEVLSSS
jgi:CheY-like chemotaxis protein